MQFWTGLWKLWGFFMILWLSWDWQVVMRLLDLCHDNSNMSAAGSWHRTFHSIMLNSFETCFCWASWSRINKCVNPLIQGDEIFTFLLQSESQVVSYNLYWWNAFDQQLPCIQDHCCLASPMGHTLLSVITTVSDEVCIELYWEGFSQLKILISSCACAPSTQAIWWQSQQMGYMPLWNTLTWESEVGRRVTFFLTRTKIKRLPSNFQVYCSEQLQLFIEYIKSVICNHNYI